MVMRLECGDCFDLLPTVPAQSVQMVLCDLPYGTTRNPWDSVLPLPQLWAEWKRVCAPGAVMVLTAAQPFTAELVQSNRAWFRYAWVWNKSPAVGFLNANKRPLIAHEDVLVFCATTPPYFPQFGERAPYDAAKRKRGKHNAQTGSYDAFTPLANGERITARAYPTSILQYPRDSHTRIHPTQKPTALFSYLVQTYTNPGDTVLDPCAGSGTTAVAAIQTGRGFVCFEKSPEYWAAASKRVCGVLCGE